MSERLIRKIATHPTEAQRLSFFCVGCREAHQFNTTWTVSGTELAPTVRPSIKVEGFRAAGPFLCHLHITDGKLEYLSDCTHALAGQTVPMQPF